LNRGDFLRPSELGFTPRQYMVSPDFEFFHNKDEALMEIEYHFHDFYEIYFFISGSVTYIIEGKSYLLKSGDIILVNNKELHKPVIEPDSTYERIVIWVNPNFIISQGTEGTNLSMCFESTSKTKYNLLRPSNEIKDNLMNIVEKLKKVCMNVSYGSNILRNIYLTELIVFLNKAFLDTYDEEIENDISFNEKVNSIILYINENLGSDLSLQFLAAKFYLSKYHLLREFKKNVGYTIHEYIQQKRLIMAKILLWGDMSVTEVCLRCGFGDYSNFIRSFKKTFGLSPQKYARQYLSKKA
jgi:AraC-like DNA-binding protein